jgi:MSHA biogenesis protein MshJ
MNANIEQARKSLRQLAQRIDALSLRERGILFAAILAALFMIANNLVFSSLRHEQQRMEREVRGKFAEMQIMNAQVETMLAQLNQDPDTVFRGRITELKKQLADEEASVAGIVRGLVSPQEMPKLVHQILSRNRALQVVQVENLPAVALDNAAPSQPGTVQQTGAAAGSEAHVYKHGMRIELKGQYLDIVRYLRALESMPAKVFWGEVQFESEKYPVSRITLVIYTISLNKAWLEV